MSYRISISVKERMQTCILEIFRDASAFQINKGTEKCVKYDIESFFKCIFTTVTCMDSVMKILN